MFLQSQLTVSLNFLVNGLVVGTASLVPIKSSTKQTVKKTACSNCKKNKTTLSHKQFTSQTKKSPNRIPISQELEFPAVAEGLAHWADLRWYLHFEPVIVAAVPEM